MQRKVQKLENGESLMRQEYLRSPTVMDEEMEEEIRDLVERDDIFTISDTQKEGKIKACKNTIWGFLSKEGYEYIKAQEKTLLTERHIEMRLSFCQKYKKRKFLVNYGLFCDESTFYCHTQPQFKWTIGQQPYMNFQPKYPTKIQVWGGICRFSTTTLKIFEGNMDGTIYKNIIENELITSVQKLFGNKKWMLIEDTDPKHVCQIANEARQNLGITRLEDWPSFSPDLNPVENIWGWLKRQVEKNLAQTKEELMDSIQNNWNRITIEFLQAFLQNYNNRLNEVIDNNGNHIDY